MEEADSQMTEMLEKIEGRKKGTTQDDMVGWHTDSMEMNLGKLRDGEGQGSEVHGVTKNAYMTKQLNNNKIGNHLLAAISMYLFAFTGRQLTG